MQNLKKKKASNNNSDNGEIPKQKERHIVSWSQEEDDILREQIRIHGTENWAIIASNFKDKSTRQCRRRWFTYLNSDFKKGGWSPEEDMLLCEAQKIIGNRWTEIAKVVSGRTDNAVKNRFSTLCKKRARLEALAKENNTSYINLNNKRVLFSNGLYTDGISETTAPLKKMRRSHISDVTENHNHGQKLLHERETHEQLRAPFAVLVQNFQRAGDLSTQHHGNNTKEICNDESDNKLQGTFLKKDDPKIHALMQQAELLSALALKVNAENTDQSLENAWKMLQDFFNQTKDDDMLRGKMSNSEVQLDDLMNLVEDLRSTIEGSQRSWRQHDLYDESPGSSENSTGSTLVPDTRGDKADQSQYEIHVKSEDFVVELQSSGIGEQNNLCESGQIILSDANIGQASDFIGAEMLPFCEELKVDNEAASALSSTNFNSPLQVTPIFRSLAAGIPSPKFSESERSFLLKTFGLESASPIANTNPSQHPPCKRALLHSL